MDWKKWMREEKARKAADDRLTAAALRWAVFAFDDANMYRSETAQSRPYKVKAAAEKLADRLNQSLPPGHRGFVVRLLR